MSTIGQIERISQQRIIQLFKEQLGYSYHGNWEERENNSNIEEKYLASYLYKQGYNVAEFTKAIYELKQVADSFTDDLYTRNKKVYSMLRYGVKVKEDVGTNYTTVKLIDWKNFDNNDFAIAEEVTIKGNGEKRPDIVLYINGIALGLLELKRGFIDISKGIRQNITNQQDRFIEHFFSTIQFVMAGNDTQGLRYGTIKTPEKFFLKWKEDEQDNSDLLIDKYLKKVCNKERLLDIIHNCILFDSGVKKLPRPHQYFGLKASQERIRKKEGGIIWHTQGSGKSLMMVLLAKWILENNADARVIILTDRTELDKQIERVFNDAGEPIKRTGSGRELLNQLTQPKPRLLCSLIHKFGRKSEDNFEDFIKELEENPVQTVGELFVFVDECHRTQSGKFHQVMKTILGNAIFIGFTGTPLLKQDKKTTLEVFGSYIHTYKFNEAVDDEVVKDLVYEGRDIDQKLSSPAKVDAWFEAKTKGLNDFQKSELKKKWGTMQNVLSSRSRMEKVVTDIIFDFSTKARLSSEKGNAILVASSIYEACKYFELFGKTELKGKCAVITSYNPTIKDVNTEDTGANTETDKEYIFKIYSELLEKIKANPNQTKTETYEDKAKEKFREEPANMKLLIVVSKLLTGFDAPPCTYLYIDKFMQDHTLFQAICRVNRLDSDDKDFGYIVDYKNLFDSVSDAINVYTSELDTETFTAQECEVLMKDRLKMGRERLDGALEELEMICEPVAPPKGQLQYFHYFCGNTEIETDLKEREPQRTALYKGIVAFIRAFANIGGELEDTGYNQKEIQHIKNRLNFYLKLREEIRIHSGEVLDLKAYEADMRHLIDNYIQADEPAVVSPFGEIPLLDLIVNSGINEAINSLPKGIKSNQQAVAETIENNVRQKIIKDHLIDPAFFEEMSTLLNAIIQERKSQALSYGDYLKKIAELALKVKNGKKDSIPSVLTTRAQRALYNNLENNVELAMACDVAVKYSKQDGFRGDLIKERMIKKSLFNVLLNDEKVEFIFQIIKNQSEY
ncbi:type I restriction endonuclease subunit R [Flavobacterium oncorhynchi]|uniref:type I restriction endonuclease subunit R n=1 Tax=Flavobacterium oncorhynchi TaxID=728056 RepID=UPI00351A30BE